MRSPTHTTVQQDLEAAQLGIRALIRLTGDDPDRPGLTDTPARWARAMLELVGDDPADPTAEELLSKVFPDVEHTGEPVTVADIPFRTVCEHHLLPFTGITHISYTPDGGRVVGLSKLPRLVDLHARQLNVQESFTYRIAHDIQTHLRPLGYSVSVLASHACTTMRGARATGATMRTAAFYGTHDTPAERARIEAL